MNICIPGSRAPVGRLMAIKNSVSSDFLLVDSINDFDCHLPSVIWLNISSKYDELAFNSFRKNTMSRFIQTNEYEIKFDLAVK